MRSRLDLQIPKDPIRGEFRVYINFKSRTNMKAISEKLKRRGLSREYRLVSFRPSIESNSHRCQHLVAIGSYRGEHPSIVDRIRKHACEDFAGFPIVRMTIKSLASNEGVPSSDIDKRLYWEEPFHCFELHYHISFEHSSLENVARRLMKTFRMRPPLESSVSINSSKGVAEEKPQCWLKVSLFNVGRNAVSTVHERLLQIWSRRLCTPLAVEPEFIVYDKTEAINK